MKVFARSLLCALTLIFSNSSFAGAFVHLFEWQWPDVANECENVLGPKGYRAVQVSPPQKSIDGSAWWTRYQPVSYAIEGRSGSREAFADMVRRCNAVGVDIYVDAVINHMAAWNRSFPEVPYHANDFHNCTTGIDYSNAWQVQNCDLVGLNDLATESDYVRGKIADYLNDLISLGVDGFRIDAAKHMPAEDVANIVNRLNGSPFIFQEVIYNGGEAVTPQPYLSNGKITEFYFTNTLGHYFKGRGALRDLQNIGQWGGWLDSDDAITFVANHDNQRQNTENTITHKDGWDVNNIAHVFALAWPYGYPKVMSSYDWNDHDQGPPSHGAGSCSNGWLCEHRQRAIANMVGFRNATDSAFYVSNWWDNGNNQIAFARGDLGFVAINGEAGAQLDAMLYTGMAAGRYCDIINGDFNGANASCSGPVIEVDAQGYAYFNVAAKQASAIHVQAKLGGVVTTPTPTPTPTLTPTPTPTLTPTPTPQPQCQYGSMFLRGSFNSWGATSMSCNNGVWQVTVALPANTQFKFDAFANWQNNWGDDNADGYADVEGDNINIWDAGTYSIEFNDNTGFYVISQHAPATKEVTLHCQNGTTYWGQSVYAVGNIAELGSWNPANALLLDSGQYPVWQNTITVSADTSIEWKCLKRESANAQAGIVWQAGANNQVSGSSSTVSSASF
ncbi:Alpha-amylase [Thalassocella blandensis]|nr:Alpha-amylase [Thalassocella blandensis]